MGSFSCLGCLIAFRLSGAAVVFVWRGCLVGLFGSSFACFWSLRCLGSLVSWWVFYVLFFLGCVFGFFSSSVVFRVWLVHLFYLVLLLVLLLGVFLYWLLCFAALFC